MDGEAVTGSLPGGIKVAFDGDRTLSITSRERTISMDPKTPAMVTAPAEGGVMLLSFGDGSGQVYALEAYDLRTLDRIDISAFTDAVYAFAARQPECRIGRDQISFVFLGWLNALEARIRTEDWSRASGCEAVYRNWTLGLPRTPRT